MSHWHSEVVNELRAHSIKVVDSIDTVRSIWGLDVPTLIGFG